MRLKEILEDRYPREEYEDVYVALDGVLEREEIETREDVDQFLAAMTVVGDLPAEAKDDVLERYDEAS